MLTKTASTVGNILTEIERQRLLDGSLVIAIDGRGGAGKSSLARALVAAIPSAVQIEYDWFHLPKEQVTAQQRYDPDRLIREVLVPFQSGQGALSFKKYNWGYLAGIPDGFDSDPVQIQASKTLVIEGCETLHKTLASYYGLRIWVDTDPAECLRRGLERDINEYKLEPTRVRDCWKEWAAREEVALRLDDRRGRADIFFK